MQIEIKVDKRKEVLKHLDEVVKIALMKCGATCEGYSKMNAPVDTGRLRNSMNHKMVSDDTVAIYSDVEYAPYQELGTSRGIKPKRFLTNALMEHISEYESIIKDEFSK